MQRLLMAALAVILFGSSAEAQSRSPTHPVTVVVCLQYAPGPFGQLICTRSRTYRIPVAIPPFPPTWWPIPVPVVLPVPVPGPDPAPIYTVVPAVPPYFVTRPARKR